MNPITLVTPLALLPPALLFNTSVMAKPLQPTEQQIQAMVDFSVTQMKREQRFQSMATCSGVSAPKLESAYRVTLEHCMLQSSWDEHSGLDEDSGLDEQTMETCFAEQFSQQTGLSQAQMESCAPEDENEQQVEELEQRINTLELEIEDLEDLPTLNASQEQQLESNIEQLDTLYEQMMQAEDALSYAQMSDKEKQLEDLFAAIGDNEPTAAQQAQIESLIEQITQENMQEVSELMQAFGQGEAQ